MNEDSNILEKIQLESNGPIYDIRDNTKSPIDHNHDDRYYTETEVDELLSGKAPIDHNHDDRYYTETEVDELLSGKSPTDHNHDSRYYTETEMDSKLQDVVKKSDFVSGSGSGMVSHAPTTLTDILTISMPAGWKVLTVRLAYSNNQPSELALGTSSYICYGQTSALYSGSTSSGKITQYLELTTFTDQTSVHVYGKWEGVGQNAYEYKYAVLPI